MRVRNFRTAASAARALARDIARSIDANPSLVLGLPTGRTPLPVYRRLVDLHRRAGLDLAKVRTFNLDEFVGLSGDDPRSYQAFMHRHFFDHVNVPAGRRHFLDGSARDLDRECRRYDRAIRRAGRLDLLILGVGVNGHVGFNEPGAALVGPTHRTRLHRSTREANREWFGGRLDDVPRQALSIGMTAVLGAHRVILLAIGGHKARVVERMVSGLVTPRLPASFLQLHPAAEIWMDDEAGARTGC